MKWLFRYIACRVGFHTGSIIDGEFRCRTCPYVDKID